MPQQNKPTSVVIVNYNRRKDLDEAIKSVKNQDYQNVEIIVVDNASTDNSVSMIKKEHPDVLLIELNENTGMDGYSIGFGYAKGDIIFQMDNDSLMPYDNILSEIVKRFENGPAELAIVATRVEEYDEKNDDIEGLKNRDLRVGPVDTGGFHSGGVGFKKELLDRLGYYNRDVFLYASEMFLQMKFLAAGFKIWFYPEILMLHKSSKAARSNIGVYYELRNRYWFFRKFASPWEQMFFFPMILANDIIYSIHKRALHHFINALKDGFSKMPDSLGQYSRSTNRDFVRKVRETGWSFSPLNTLKLVSKIIKKA